MSYQVKREDIPDEFAEKCWIHISGDHFEPSDVALKWSISEVLNAAIEAGLVSPPVYTVRDKDGYLLDDGIYGLYSDPDRALDGHEDGCTAEHWKGQTE